MKHFHFLQNGRTLVIICALLITLAPQARSHFRRLNVWYMQSNLPNQCLFPASLPDVCTSTVQDEICTVYSGSISITYFKTATCITPFWRKS